MEKNFIICLLAIFAYLQLGAQTLSDTAKWGQISLCCAHLRAKPSHASELSTEALMGTPVKILGKEGEWYHILTPDEYESWVHPASLSLKSSQEMKEWREAERYIYTVFQGFIYETPERDALPVSDIVAGCILTAGEQVRGKYIAVTLPDGRKGYVKKEEVQRLREWAGTSADVKKMVAFARQMTGSTYLWGGTSVKGTDCSGFTRIIYYSAGILLMRDASQQARTGEQLKPEEWQTCKTGDLLFFGNDAGRVNHVAFYLGNGEFIHSSGRVRINSLDKNSRLFMSLDLVGISHILSRVGTPGITLIKEHPWYFNL